MARSSLALLALVAIVPEAIADRSDRIEKMKRSIQTAGQQKAADGFSEEVFHPGHSAAYVTRLHRYLPPDDPKKATRRGPSSMLALDDRARAHEARGRDHSTKPPRFFSLTQQQAAFLRTHRRDVAAEHARRKMQAVSTLEVASTALDVEGQGTAFRQSDEVPPRKSPAKVTEKKEESQQQRRQQHLQMVHGALLMEEQSDEPVASGKAAHSPHLAPVREVSNKIEAHEHLAGIEKETDTVVEDQHQSPKKATAAQISSNEQLASTKISVGEEQDRKDIQAKKTEESSAGKPVKAKTPKKAERKAKADAGSQDEAESQLKNWMKAARTGETVDHESTKQLTTELKDGPKKESSLDGHAPEDKTPAKASDHVQAWREQAERELTKAIAPTIINAPNEQARRIAVEYSVAKSRIKNVISDEIKKIADILENDKASDDAQREKPLVVINSEKDSAQPKEQESAGTSKQDSVHQGKPGNELPPGTVKMSVSPVAVHPSRVTPHDEAKQASDDAQEERPLIVEKDDVQPEKQESSGSSKDDVAQREKRDAESPSGTVKLSVSAVADHPQHAKVTAHNEATVKEHISQKVSHGRDAATLKEGTNKQAGQEDAEYIREPPWRRDKLFGGVAMAMADLNSQYVGPVGVGTRLLPIGCKMSENDKSLVERARVARQGDHLFQKLQEQEEQRREDDDVMEAFKNAVTGAKDGKTEAALEEEKAEKEAMAANSETPCKKTYQSSLWTVFDTGSTNIWMSSDLCQSGPCTKKGRERYDHKRSVTFQAPKRYNSLIVEFGTGSLVGPQAVDDFHLGPFTVANQTFALMQQQKGSVFQWIPFEGIIGLAFPAMSASHSTPFFDSLVQQKAMPKNEFAFYLGHGPEDNNAVFWGGVDPAFYEGPIEYFPVHQPYYWAAELHQFKIGHECLLGHHESCTVQAPAWGFRRDKLWDDADSSDVGDGAPSDVALQVGPDSAKSGEAGQGRVGHTDAILQLGSNGDGQKERVGNERRNKLSAIVDTGTTFMTAESYLFHHVVERLPEADCNKVTSESHPDVVFTLRNVAGELRDFVLTNKEYMAHDDDVLCQPSFMKIDIPHDHGPAMVLGEVFLRNYLAVFDRDSGTPGKARIGFARSRHGKHVEERLKTLTSNQPSFARSRSEPWEELQKGDKQASS